MKRAILAFAFIQLAFNSAPIVFAEEFDSAGTKIYYAVAGEGKPVILIHGLYSSAKLNWDKPGISEDLAKNFRVVTLDCRGHGRSDKPKSDEDYGTNMVEDVVRLLDHLHIKKARIVGYSMGGMIALKLVTMHPDRVDSVILGGMGWLRPDSPQQDFWKNIPSFGLTAPAACMHGMAKLAVTADEVKAVKVPVTVIIGDNDPCRKMYVEPLEKIRPDWPVQVITNAGHLSCIVKEEFKTELKSALESKSAKK